MNSNTPTISTNLKLSAFGATLAMLPFAFIILIAGLTQKEPTSESTAKLLIVLQFFGTLLWGIPLLAIKKNADRLGVSSSGLTTCAVGIFIGGLMQILFILSPETFEPVFKFIYGGSSGFAIILIVTCIPNIPLFVGMLTSGKRLPALRSYSTVYLLLALFPLVMLGLAKVFIKHSAWSYHSTGLETFLTISAALLFLLCLLGVIGWWKASGNASEIEEEYNEENGDIITEATYVEQPAATQTSGATATGASASAAAPIRGAGTPVTEEQRKLIMSMSDQELTNVVNNPMLYANPAFVEEARTTLVKRQAWEMIKDYPDAQLLDIVHNNTQGFAYEVLDAASMELYARQSEEFVNEIRSLSIEELQGIVSNPDSYFDGYLRLATAVLNERINPEANAPQQ